MELHWTKNRPTVPGAYWVRGYHVGYRDEAALVEVREIDGELCSNLHNANSDARDPMPLADHSDRFEWCGPLVPANAGINRSRECARELFRDAVTVEVKAVGTGEDGVCRIIAYSTPLELAKGPSLVYKRAKLVLQPNDKVSGGGTPSA